MTNITQEQFSAAFSGWELVNKTLRDFAEEFVKEFGDSLREDITEVRMEYGMIEISTEESSCSCCGPDHNSYSVPVEYLWTDWRVTEKAARDKQKQIREEEAKRKKEQEEKARLEQRRKQYLSMKKEFEAQ